LVGGEVGSQCKLKGHLHLKAWIIIFFVAETYYWKHWSCSFSWSV